MHLTARPQACALDSGGEPIGATAFAMFTKKQRQWTSPPYTDETIERFKTSMVDPSVVPTPGSVVTASLEGSRPILVELQALASSTSLGTILNEVPSSRRRSRV